MIVILVSVAVRPTEYHYKWSSMLTDSQLDSSDRLARGEKARREVLGDSHVDASAARMTGFTRPIQEFVTGSCWGDIWGRPGLDRRIRSLLNLVMLTALNRPHELALHVRGAVNNGVTLAEIQEALLQTAVYCGVPAALEAFKVAEKTLGAETIAAADLGADAVGEAQ
jgi:4-carboxymuconolactone decarboxylase